jgi:hypothetical protein
MTLASAPAFNASQNGQTGFEIAGERWQHGVKMSVAELKDSVLALAPEERHEFVAWVNRLEAEYGDVPGEALDQLAAEIWDHADRHAPPTHPPR